MLYRLAKWIARIVMKLLFNVDVEGVEKIPTEGSLIVCANHISGWDPLLIACIMPRPVSFMAKKELFKSRILAFLFTKLYAFPVNREKPDLGAIRKGLAVLKDENVLGIFPEGTRQKTFDKLGVGHGGAALFAIKTGAPILPVAIRGRYNFKKTVKIACGDPITIAPSTEKLSKDVQAGSVKVMEAIKQLWENLESGKVA